MTRWLFAAVVLLSIPACSGDGTVARAPLAPTRVSSVTPAPPPAGGVTLSGDIVLTSVHPPSGATLSVRDCGDRGHPGTSRLCSDDFRATLAVRIDRDMLAPVLTVGFYDGDVLCAYAAATLDALTAGEAATFTPAVTYFSWERWSGQPVTVQPCTTPVTTTRLVAELWSDASPGTLTREFSRNYAFQTP
jgi:hypothetical protein